MDRELFLERLKTHWELHDIPNISRENAKYLRNIIAENNTQHLLEIGSANGYSTINFAIELEKTWGKITSIEFSQIAYEDATENYEKAWVTDIISHYFWDARDIIPLLEDSYDFIFIDGLKKESLNFLKIIWDKALPWCIIVIDDVIKFRHKMESLYEYVTSENLNYEVIQIDSDDGIMIIKKPSN
jgi:predicted O-methyltransferase YrrM